MQLARARGAQVIAVTSSEKFRALLALGAVHTVTIGTNLTNAPDTDSLVIGFEAGKQWPERPDVLKPFGRHAAARAIAGPIVEGGVRPPYVKDLSLFGFTTLGDTTFNNLNELVELQQIAPVVSQMFKLKGIARAQTSLSPRHILANW